MQAGGPGDFGDTDGSAKLLYTCLDFYLIRNTAPNPGFDYHEVIISSLPTCRAINTLVLTMHAGNCGESAMLLGLLAIEL